MSVRMPVFVTTLCCAYTRMLSKHKHTFSELSIQVEKNRVRFEIAVFRISAVGKVHESDRVGSNLFALNRYKKQAVPITFLH